jgi:uncharacterized protein DUF4236
MSFRFRKRIRLGKFLRVNLSKSGASLSIGRRGATVQRRAPRDESNGRHSWVWRELPDADRKAQEGRIPAVDGKRDHVHRDRCRRSLVDLRALMSRSQLSLYRTLLSG